MYQDQTPAHLSFFHRGLADLVGRVCAHPRVVLAFALVLCAGSVYASCRWVQFHTQRSDLVSPKKDYQQRWNRHLEEFGDDDDIVVVVEGTDRPRMRAAIERIAAAVEAKPDRFDRLFYRVDLRRLRDRALLYLPEDQITQIRDNLKRMNLLLELGPISWHNLSVVRLLQEARDRAGKIDPDRPLPTLDEQFFTQLRSISESAAASLDDPTAYRTPWQSLLGRTSQHQDILAEPQYFFSAGGPGKKSLAFLLVRPVKEPGSFTAAQPSVAALRGIVAGLREEFGGLEFGLTGLPVLETDEMVAAERDTRLASWLATAGITTLFFFVYRRVSYPLLTVATLLIGTGWATGWLAVTVGHVNILTATFAVMLIGMGDYGVLWVMRYEQERQSGAGVTAALRQTAVCVGTGTMTAALTTALAFFAATAVDFQAVAELGWIAGSGVLLCALSCFTVLPALLTLFDRRDRPAPVTLPHPVAGSWLPGMSRRAGWIVGGSVALTSALAVPACLVPYDHNLLHLQAQGIESVRWELKLIDQTAGMSWHALSSCASREEAIALKARYEQLPEVSRVVEVASLIPAGQDTKLDLLRDIRHRLRNLPARGHRIAHGLPDGHATEQQLALLIGQLEPLADRAPQSLLPELRRSLMGLHQKMVRMPTRRLAEERLQLFEERLATDLAEDLHRLRDVSTPEPLTIDDFPPSLRERYVGKSGRWLVQAFGKDYLWDFPPLEHFVAAIAAVDPEATGKPFATIEGLRSMKAAFQWAGLYAFVAIVVVLLADFRSPWRMLIAISPLVMGITLALGFMGLVGMPLNPANMIALPLIIGVGVDNGVHILHDFLAVKAEGKRTVSRAIGRGVLVKALTTMIGFGTLMISTQRGLVGLGFCLTLGVCCCMASALVFLPALLHQLKTQASRGRGIPGSDAGEAWEMPAKAA